MKSVVIEREMYHECQRGELRAKGKMCLQWTRKGNSENLLSFYTISFFLCFSVFSFEGWVPMPFEINNLFPPFFLGRGKINKSTDEGNPFKEGAGVWNLRFGEVSCTQPALGNQFCLQMNLHSRIGT